MRSAENTTAQFDLNEYETVWKNPVYAPWGFRQYADFNVSAPRLLPCVPLMPA
jgi:alpha-1,3-glucan synthase